MLRHVIAPAGFFSQVPNEIIRHPRLSSDAVRLLTWQLSLPDGADEPLSATAKRAGITKTGFIRAKRQLAAEGYLHEWRRQDAAGRWSTLQLVSSTPLSAGDAAAVRDGRPTAENPAAGDPTGRSIGRHPKNTRENTSHPPRRAPVSRPMAAVSKPPGREREAERLRLSRLADASAQPPLAVPMELVKRAGLVLTAISHSERRLRLSGRDVQALAPLAADWLQRGATVTDIGEALTQQLPERVHSPAGLVRDRLVRKRPDAPVHTAEVRAQGGPDRPRVAEMRECEGQHVQPYLFRPVGSEVLCPACRCGQAGADVSRAIDAALRGGAVVRQALRHARTV
ncbi:hypothetical protein CTZ27_35535 [Streptomyces griseocarneus]|nr:hypothetical protein CTZ27_35535 [Streptomyces griseocarneus]